VGAEVAAGMVEEEGGAEGAAGTGYRELHGSHKLGF
jgi:hypothetical protein